MDSDRNGAMIQNHKAFMSNGHDEYAGQRANVEAARDAGVHLVFFSGNEVFWKTRWRTARRPPSTPYRTLVEDINNAKIRLRAEGGLWAPRYLVQSAGRWRSAQNALTGTIFMVNDGVVCAPDCSSEPEGKARFSGATPILQRWRPVRDVTLPFGRPRL